jgi:subtilisin family serine protease
LLSAICVFGCLTSTAQQSVPGQILVKPKARLSESEFATRVTTHHASYRRTIRNFNVRVLNVPEDSVETVLSALRQDPGIEYAERDGIARAAFVPNDPYVVSGSEWHLARISAPQAWDFSTGTGNIVVAILDSGISPAHPDLAGQLLPGYDFVWGDTNTADDFGHGTAVAGVVAAAGNNDLGVAGVAYSCSLLPVKVMDTSGTASYSCVAEGIRYAVDQGARIINLSIAGDSPSSTLQDAVNYAWSNNVVIVAAAGNYANTTPQYPAACDHVVAVAATEPDDSLAAFSSFGSYVSLCAPGDNIWTTQRDLSNPYGSWRGTSFASPIVAGVAALALSANPGLSVTQVVSVLESSADDLGPAGYDTTFGYGRVNAQRAVSEANPDLKPLSVTQTQTNVPANNYESTAFSPVSGHYAGLVLNLEGVTPDNSGAFRLNVTKKGRFTGRILNQGRGHGFHGQFDATGNVSLTVKRGSRTPLTVSLRVNLVQPNDEVAGLVTDGSWSSDLSGARNVFNGRLNPAQQAGLHPFVLQPANNPAVTAATGTSHIARNGFATVHGRLSNGPSFRVASSLAKNGDCPFYVSLNHGGEIVIGWLNFASQAPNVSGRTVLLVNSTPVLAATALTATSAP